MPSIVRPVATEADKTYVHTQSVAAAVWTVAHNLAKKPAVTIVDTSGRQVEGDVEYLDNNTCRLTFSAAFSGEAYCN